MRPSRESGRSGFMLPVRRSRSAGFSAEYASRTSKNWNATARPALSRYSGWPRHVHGRFGRSKPQGPCQENTKCSLDRALCGRDGIRTHDRLSPVPASQAGTINHSDTLGDSQRSDSLERIGGTLSQSHNHVNSLNAWHSGARGRVHALKGADAPGTGPDGGKLGVRELTRWAYKLDKI